MHVFDHSMKKLSYTVDQREDTLEQESRFPYKEEMHINYSNWCKLFFLITGVF